MSSALKRNGGPFSFIVLQMYNQYHMTSLRSQDTRRGVHTRISVSYHISYIISNHIDMPAFSINPFSPIGTRHCTTSSYRTSSQMPISMSMSISISISTSSSFVDFKRALCTLISTRLRKFDRYLSAKTEPVLQESEKTVGLPPEQNISNRYRPNIIGTLNLTRHTDLIAANRSRRTPDIIDPRNL